MIDEALPAGCPAGGLRHACLDRVRRGPGPVAGSRLTIDERQPLQRVGQEGLAPREPDMAQASHVLALLFKGLQGFSCVSARARATPAGRMARWPAMPGFGPVLPPVRRA
jgi:hypothetical protein